MLPPSDLATAPDRAVIAWILEGSAAACRELHNRYEAPVFDALLKRVGDPDVASDLTQETFDKVYQHLATFDQARPFAPWIHKIAKNTARDHFREERREARARQRWLDQTSDGWRFKEGIPPSEPKSSNPSISVERLNQEFERAREYVNRTYLDCFWLHYVQDKSYADIATKHHVTEATARSYANRAKKKLEVMFGKLRNFLLTTTRT